MSEPSLPDTDITDAKPSQKEIVGNEETEKEKQTKAFKRNSN